MSKREKEALGMVLIGIFHKGKYVISPTDSSPSQFTKEC